MKTSCRIALALIAASTLNGCATNDNPPCRRVNATEFMRPHTFKGVPSDRFIGISSPKLNDSKQRKAFKEIWQMGLFYGWAVIWIPVDELPSDYLAEAHRKPNRTK